MNRELTQLEKRVETLEAIVTRLIGDVSGFVSLPKAAKLLGRSQSALRTEIRDAEKARSTRGYHRLQYGTHYVNIASENSARPTYQINWQEWQKLPPPGTIRDSA